MQRPQTLGTDRRRRMGIIIEVIVLVVACIAALLGLYFSGYLTLDKTSVVVYEVTSSNGRARISYTQLNGQMSELMTVSTPWRKTIIFNEWLDLYLIAGNPATTGDITCSVKVNQRNMDKQKAIYPDDKVACRAILP